MTIGEFLDTRDSKVYKWALIGGRTWMAENLNFAASGSKCYEDNTDNCSKYGRLYDWSAAKSACPNGWHLPSDAEWDALMTAVGDSSTAGTKLKARSGWNSNGNGTDDYNFSALPSGIGNPNGFFYAGDYGFWWSSTEYDASFAWNRNISYNYANVRRDRQISSVYFSVRCVSN
jgi:uncharacterized protein (TIGR02145 family)